MNQPAPAPAGRDPGDPRRAITIDQLLGMTSGLALGNSLEELREELSNEVFRAARNCNQ